LVMAKTSNLMLQLFFAALFLWGADSVVVSTQFGQLEGIRIGMNVDQFMGIPYAMPPVNQSRFKDPVPWNTTWAPRTRPATEPGSQCRQGHEFGPSSEDCLFLNIWRPAAPDARSENPVMVFIHGGSFVNGNGDQYNSTRLVKKHGVVVVTLNYRLGHLGWLQVYPGLANYGLKDQRVALQWVKENIAAFGGNPEHILLFGESAGAISVATHLVTPKSNGLYHGALMESGFPQGISRSLSTELGQNYSALAGCGNTNTASERLDCLQDVSLHKLEEIAATIVPSGGNSSPFTRYSWGPVIDGVEIVEDPLVLLRDGAFNNHVPLLAGTNTNEGSVFVYPYFDAGLNATGYKQFVSGMLDSGEKQGLNLNRSLVGTILDFYPPSDTEDNRPLAAQLAADYSFICGTRFLARMVNTYSIGSGNAVYLYRFNYHATADTTPRSWGITHGSEVPFVFDHGDWEGGTNASFTDKEEKLAAMMGMLWASFARNGAPAPSSFAMGGHHQSTQNKSDVIWPAYTNTTDSELVFDVGDLQIEKHPRALFCDFWMNLLHE